eukprot:3421116-Rhodomonas_salina.1
MFAHRAGVLRACPLLLFLRVGWAGTKTQGSTMQCGSVRLSAAGLLQAVLCWEKVSVTAVGS